MKEATVEAYFVRRVKEAGGQQRKIVSPGYNGMPDRIAGFDRAGFAFVELKRPGGVAEPHQLREHDRWRKLGFAVYVLDTFEAVDKFIKEMV